MWDNLEPDEKHCYSFKIKMTVEATGYVFAKNEDEARELIKSKEWSDIELDTDSYDNIDIDEVIDD